MSGTKDSSILKLDHSFVIFEIQKCTLLTRQSIGQEIECAEEDMINQWLERKKVAFRILQDKVDYNAYDNSYVIRQNEIFSYSIPIDAGKFSDVGYRLR